jgi:YnbE-like lipoprotein
MTMHSRWRRARLLAVPLLGMPLTGCITVNPPDRPIEINLNVEISQEVVVRLQEEAQRVIQQNPEAFPPREPRR